MRRQIMILCTVAAVLSASVGHAQPFPSKPIRMVVPFAAGGPSDISARNIAPRMTELLGVPAIVVDNRGGANGIIGAEMVAKALPDGYTLLVGTATITSINMVVYPKLPYDTLRDLQVNGMFVDLPVILPHVKAGKARAIAIASSKRSVYLPDAPSTAEAGYPGVEVSNQYSLLLPAKTPREIVMKLHDAVARTMATPDVREKFINVGADPLIMSPEEFTRFIRADIEKWGKVAQRAGVRMD